MCLKCTRHSAQRLVPGLRYDYKNHPFRQISEPLEKILDAFCWRHLSRKSAETRATRQEKQMTIVAPYILLASGTASAGRVPAPPEDTSVN